MSKRITWASPKGSKKIKRSREVGYTPNTESLEEKDGADGGVEGPVNQDRQATQRKCASFVHGTHSPNIGPRWGKPRRTGDGLESQNDPQRDARARERDHVCGCLWIPRTQTIRRALAQSAHRSASHC